MFPITMHRMSDEGFTDLCKRK